jgi:phage baseplate assembly protein W
LTPVGALTRLGHPDYGCRLAELIGRLNNDATRNLAKLYVLLALGAEPRVKEVVSVDVTPDPGDRTRITIAIVLVPIDSQTALNLVFPFSLGGGVTP